jgi:hypothetical protein
MEVFDIASKYFGAVADGVTDETEAVKKAFLYKGWYAKLEDVFRDRQKDLFPKSIPSEWAEEKCWVEYFLNGFTPENAYIDQL